MQGSSLGPLLFLFFINDLSNSTSCLPRLFADDTCLVISNEKPSSLETQINEELSTVLIWCKANKSIEIELSGYTLKTEYSNTKNVKMYIALNNSILSTCENIKYLGINIDPHLNFLPTLSQLNVKSLVPQYKLKPFRPKLALLKIYQAIIHPYLLYALPAW